MATDDDTAASGAVTGALAEFGLTLPMGLPIEQWIEVGQRLMAVEKSIRWAIGDWLVYGEANYGEAHAQAIEDSLELSAKSIANMAWVAKAYPPDVRVAGLSWSHHAVVASKPPAQRARLLAQARVEHWSEKDLRDRVATTTTIPAPTTGTGVKVCRQCNRTREEILAELDR